MGACGSCGGYRSGRASRAAAANVDAYKVVDGNGDCLLATSEGLCRVFGSLEAAIAAARAEVGSSGWTPEPVYL